MDSITLYKNRKKKHWIEHQLSQKMLVFCYSNNLLVVIRHITLERDGSLVAYSGNKTTTLTTQPIYSTYQQNIDLTNPVGTFKDQPLSAAEYAELICKCI